MKRTVVATATDVARSGAAAVAAVARAADAEGRVASVALSGGSTPAEMYTLLRGTEFADLPWHRLAFFMGDDRLVPLDHEWSNYGLAERELFSQLAESDAPAATHPINTSLSAAEAARAYEQLVVAAVAAGANGLPRFDLVLLGLGSDRHTASLFPGHPEVEEQRALVVPAHAGELPPPVDRVTFTFGLINAAARVVLLATGAGKADALADLERYASLPEAEAVRAGVPSALIRPSDGIFELVTDVAA